ncbi:MAG: chromosome segregation protein SMC [Gaiellales bacterium]
MHLRSIRLRGFKSFVEPVEVKLEPGVAVVVGPNGSGKSNVADAIVWAAGSLTPSELRAERPDDVLFGGADGRAAADSCEVELLFDNEDGAFSEELDYSEIAITRRLVRGGEGQYLVNKAPVRRTDLVELLADVGLGGSMHSIVSQGKVDAVLASKPEDRRHLIEEAAGLGKFKRRKHRAELKLARVQIQVERARDVEDEVRKRLRPLALQATAAERAEKLGFEIGGLRAQLARLDLADVDLRQATAEQRRQESAAARRDAQASLSALLATRERAETELSDASGKREAILGSLYRLRSAAERVALRRESAAGLGERVSEDLGEARRAASAKTDAALQALDEAAARASGEARDRAAESGRASERARHAHARLAAHDRSVQRVADEKLERLRAERRQLEAGIAESSGGQTEANRRLVAVGAARERLAARQENATALVARLAAEHAEAREVARRGGPTPAELEAAANEAAASARAAVNERDDVSERARATRERLAALERSLEAQEGLAPAARALEADGERVALSALEARPGFERAVAAALAWRASAILAGDKRQAFTLLERARGEELGPLTVVVDSTTSERVAPLAELMPLRSLATGPDDALRLLEGVWLVDEARLLEATHGVVVTEAGHGYDADRGELWFAGAAAEAMLLELDARRRALAEEVAELEARVTTSTAAAERAAVAASEAEAAFAAVAHLRERVLDVELLGRLATAAGALQHQLRRSSELVATLEAPIAATVQSGSRAAAELGEELRKLAALEFEAQRDAGDAGRNAQAAEVVVARLGGLEESVSLEVGIAREGLVTDAADALRRSEEAAREAREAAERARAAEAMLVERAPRRSGLDVDLLERLGSAVAQLSDELTRAAGIGDRLEVPVKERADAGAARAGELGEELRRLGAEEVELRGKVEQAAERATAVEVELARLGADAEEARRRLAEALAMMSDDPDSGPATGETHDEGVDRGELAARIERLESRREALGRVNPLAKEEYEAEKVRLDELARQREDLEESLAEIEKLRDELAETVQRRFDDTFATVAANFEEVATTLFPGGEGRLRLVEPDEEVGEGGVEVELRPAGKRITRLSLLSGGEKALGAIAFLFALFLAKPCPFYLLDEVEAALDDSNVGRFVELLRRYADRAQFIVITHQKRTMEAADVLYGVTMGGDGVSEIVSRRLPREERAAATA